MKYELSQLHPSNITTVTSVTKAIQSGSHEFGTGPALCDCSLCCLTNARWIKCHPPSLPGPILLWLTWFIFSISSKPQYSIWPWERKTTERFGLLSEKYGLLYTFIPRWKMCLTFVYNFIDDSWLQISVKMLELKGRQWWCRFKSEHDKVLKKGISTFDARIDSWKSGHWFLSFNCCVRWCNQGQYQVGRSSVFSAVSNTCLVENQSGTWQSAPFCLFMENIITKWLSFHVSWIDVIDDYALRELDG